MEVTLAQLLSYRKELMARLTAFKLPSLMANSVMRARPGDKAPDPPQAEPLETITEPFNGLVDRLTEVDTLIHELNGSITDDQGQPLDMLLLARKATAQTLTLLKEMHGGLTRTRIARKPIGTGEWDEITILHPIIDADELTEKINATSMRLRTLDTSIQYLNHTSKRHVNFELD